MLKAISVGVYLLVFLPIWAYRRITGASRFGRSFRKRPSAWDLDVPFVPAPVRTSTARPTLDDHAMVRRTLTTSYDLNHAPTNFKAR